MNAYENAMRMELEAEKSYRDMAEQTTDSTIRKVLLMLADEEVKHYKVFEKMAKQENVTKEVADFDVSLTAKDIFTELKDENKRYSFTDEQVEFYDRAAKVEDKAYEFYLQQAENAEDAETKEAFMKIAAEEKKHGELMENLAHFVASPSVWLESAEFYQITEEH